MAEEQATTIEESPSVAAADEAAATPEAAPQDTGSDSEKQRDQNDWNYFQQMLSRKERGESDEGGEPEAEASPEAEEGDEQDKAPEAETEEGEGSDTDEPAAQPEGFEEALAAMVRDGLPEERIKAWYQDDPEGFVKHGQKRSKAQKDVDRLYGSAQSKAQPQTPDGESQASPEAAAPKAQAEAPKAPRDIIEAVEKRIGEVLDPLTQGENADLYGELRAPLGVAFTSLAESIAGYYEQKVAQDRQQYSQQSEAQRLQLVDVQLEQSRDRLASKYPDIANDEVYQQVLQRYDTLVASGKFQSVREAFQEAAKWTFSDTNPANQIDRLKSELLTRNRQRKGGTPKARTAGNTEKQVSPEDRERLAFERIHRQHFGEHTA